MEEFIPPPEAPVFQPTAEEFKDPIAYITKIRPVVVNTGICKIRPPANWRPPFAIDVENFHFTPRVQPLNELEAKTRVKLNFLDNLARFWELQGVTFKVPNVDRHPLDLHKLFKIVTLNGGFDEVSHQRKWTIVTKEMSYYNPTVAGSLRTNYEKYLYPYEIFLQKNSQIEVKPSPHKVSPTTTPVKRSCSPSSKCKYGLRHNKRRNSNWEDPDYVLEMDEGNPEFRKLAFTAPGPKNSFAPLKRGNYSERIGVGIRRRGSICSTEDELPPQSVSVKQEPPEHAPPDLSNTTLPPPLTQVGPNSTTDSSEPVKQELQSERGGSYDRRLPPQLVSESVHLLQCSPSNNRERQAVGQDEVKCVSCASGESGDELLLCDGCDASYHTFCLDPPMPSVPPGGWRCPHCLAQECIKPQETFGFEQAEKQYTIRSFGQMANSFKQQYFNMSTREVPYSVVEREFWRLVNSIEDEVTVEYGADLLSSQVGSGFPMKGHVRSPDEDRYATSGWNLNNIPNLPGSALRFIDVDISGMKVPWVYVGMCFSCFCWHIEDHWSYSINYLHWGEPKTWYGVPSAYAESLEATMKEQAPELFEHQPDLLHHLVTTLSPTVLMKHGIPVVRTDQCAGEFVITFPRAYHAGFNQGFNFAEAVNFSLADWLPIGRESISHYRSLQRMPVFSHNELVCKMVAQPDRLELCLLVSATEDASSMIETEQRLRDAVAAVGVVKECREVFELAADDERQCMVCKTCCFLSAVRCSCNIRRLVCLYHTEDICNCPNSKKLLKYRYTMAELHQMLSVLRCRTETYQCWVNKVEGLLDGGDAEQAELQYLQHLLKEASDNGYSSSEVYDELKVTIQDIEKCAATAVQIASGKLRSRGYGLDVEELRGFLKQVDSLPCKIPEANKLKDRLAEVEAFQRDVLAELLLVQQHAENRETHPIANLEQLLKRGEQLQIHVPEMNTLKMALQQTVWVSETEAKLEEEVQTIDGLRSMLRLGNNLAKDNTAVEEILNKVKSLLTVAQDWEQKAKSALKQKPPQNVEFFKSMLDAASRIPVSLPSVHTITNSLEKAHNWSGEAQVLQDSDKHPHYDTLKTMLSSGRPIPVKLELLAQLESRYAAAKAWVDRAARAFLKKNSPHSLIEALLPRTYANFFLRHINKGGKKKSESELTVCQSPLSDVSGDRLKEMNKIHEMEAQESKYATQLRNENMEKMQRDEQIKSGLVSGSPIIYCFCRKPESGYMLQCELCHEWYHASCLHIPKGKRAPEKDIGKESRFLCSACQRTRRPRLDAIISLLISLQKVPVAISEGTALHCIAERAIASQRKARTAISHLNGVLESAKQQKRRIEELKGHIKRWRNEALANRDGTTVTSIQAQLASSAGSVLQHYESELQRLRAEYAGLSGNKRTEFENLLTECDLLEVTMDEVQQLWQLLQQDTEILAAFEKLGSDIDDTEEEENKQTPSEPAEDDKKRKRKRQDPSPAPSTTSSTGSSDNSKGQPPSKKKKKQPSRTTTPKPRQSPAPSNSSAATPVKRRPPPTRDPRRKSRRESNDSLGCNEEIPDEEEGDCSAPECLQPMVDEISWVQCDRCQEWFHCMCVGLTKEYAEQIDSFICSSCKQYKPSQPTATTTQPSKSSSGALLLALVQKSVNQTSQTGTSAAARTQGSTSLST